MPDSHRPVAGPFDSIVAAPNIRDMERDGVCCGSCRHYGMDEALCHRFLPRITVVCLAVCDEWGPANA